MEDIMIPKDFKDYEPKLIGSFTIRQTVLVVPGFILAVMFQRFFSTDLFIFLTILTFSLIWALGWTKPYNMRFEEFVATSFVKMFLSPKQRIYKNENLHRVILETADAKDKKTEESKKKKKKKFRNIKEVMDNEEA